MKNRMMALGTLALVSTACNPIVLDPLHDGAQGVQSPSSSGPSTSSGAPDSSPSAVSVIAARAGDLPSTVPLFDASGSSDSAPFWADPESLVLIFSSDAQQCSHPLLEAVCRTTTPFWQVTLAIPPQVDRPGTVDLQDPRVQWTETLVVPGDPGASGCSGGYGYGINAGTAGTLEIVSSDPTTVSVRLSGFSGLSETIHINGDYVVPRCGAAPIAAPPAPAVAIRASTLPLDPSVTTSGGGAATDPDTLLVFLGSDSATCQDPWSIVNCDSTSRLTFSLPPSLQKPGVVDLSDPAINAKFNAAGPDAASTCAPADVPPAAGTLEILSSDASGLSFKILGSLTSGVTRGSFEVDGLYATSICP